MKKLCAIPIKANSERLKDKNFLLLGNKPLYQHLLLSVIDASCYDLFCVDTDSEDIKEFCNQAREYGPEDKAVAIHIHGMDSADIAIDIGAGAKRTFGNGSILGTKVLNSRNNQGDITLKISQIKKMRQLLSSFIKDKYDMSVTIGKRHTGWSKQSAIQFHKHEGRDDYAVQFEISHRFRLNKEKRNYIIDCLTSTLKEIFL